MARPRDHAAQVDLAIMQAAAQVRLPPDKGRQLREELRAAILGAGLIQQHLDDPTVTEIMVIGTGVWLERNGVVTAALPLPSAEDAYALAEDLAQKVGQRFQRARPLVNLTWPDGSRINLVHPMLSPRGTCITIRKPDRSRPLDLADLVAGGSLSAAIADFLVAAVRGRLNLCLGGSTGSGKTTLLRALAAAVLTDSTERVIVLEDTEELRLRHPHVASLVATQAGDAERGVTVTLRDLFLNALRMRPDRLIVGEVRGAEALDALEAAKSEHGGLLFTMHLRAPEELGSRLLLIAQREGLRFDDAFLRREVYDAVDVVVQLDKLRDGRRRVTRVAEPDPETATMRDLFLWDPETDDWTAPASLSAVRQRRLAAAGGAP
jgi:pilus assembly protein CpaF